MEGVEFYIIGNQTCIRKGGVSKPLTEHELKALKSPYSISRAAKRMVEKIVGE